MQREIRELVETSLTKARRFKDQGYFGPAYAHYTVVIELCPGKREEVEEEFTDVLCEWGEKLEKDNNKKKTLMCYFRSLDIYPKNARMLNNCAFHCLRRDLVELSICLLKRAVAANPDYLPAERNLDYAFNRLVARWHFPMLNDRIRNSKFDRAISKKISKGYDTVLDIGTGTGLLSLYARDAGAKKVYACEYSKEMSEIARQVFDRNNARDIELFNKHSSCLNIPNDLPEKVKLLVTETFDTALFGELILSTLINAHENLLDKAGIILPMSASVFISAVESEHIRFASTVNHFQNDTHPSEFLNFDRIKVFSEIETYDSTKLDIQQTIFITDPQEILKIDFNSLNLLKKLRENGLKNIVQATCKCDGIIDGLIAWFKLNLDEENFLDTSNKESCWEYAVFPTQSITCTAGEELTISVAMRNESLKCTHIPNTKKKNNIDDEKTFHVSTDVIRFLNDIEFMSSIYQVVWAHKKKTIHYIFDACPFPIYGLQLLKHNPVCKGIYCYVKSKELTRLILKVAKENGINQNRIHFVDGTNEVEKPLDVIFYQNFTTQGDIEDWNEPSVNEVLSKMLSPTGFVLPNRIFLMGQLGYSSEIPKMVLVNDRNLQKSCQSSNYIVGEFINGYTGKQRFDLDMTVYQFEAMSEEKVLIQVDENRTIKNTVNFGKIEISPAKKIPNVLVSWYGIQLEDGLNVISSRRKNSFINHSAFEFENDLKECSKRGQEVEFDILMMKGLTRILLKVSCT